MKRTCVATILPLGLFFPILGGNLKVVANAIPLSNAQLSDKAVGQTAVDSDLGSGREGSESKGKSGASAGVDTLTSRNSEQADRQSLPLVTALLGKWTTNDGKTEYYFAPGQVTVVNQVEELNPIEEELPGEAGRSLEEQLLQPEQQIIQVMKYEIVSVDEANGTVQLKIKTPLNWLEERTLKFTPNRQVLTEFMDLFGHDLSSEWTYVGQQQQP
jgi:hypothetical protein